MAIFRIKTASEWLSNMVDRVVTRSELTDINPGSNVMQILGAVARALEVASVDVASLLSLFSIFRARGADLDARAEEIIPDAQKRAGSARSVGTVRWTYPSPGPSSTILIPSGTLVARTDVSPRAIYVTTEAGQILAGATVSTSLVAGDITARADVGGLAGNCVASAINVQVNVIPGTTGVSNPLPFAGGQDRESDDSFRDRLIDYTRTLAKCTIDALVFRARQVKIDTDGDGITDDEVRVAQAVEDVFNRGDVDLYIDNGTGTAGVFASSGGTDALISGATGGEMRFFTNFRPLVNPAPAPDYVLTRTPSVGPAVALTPGVDYILTLPWGRVDLSPTVFPTGLTAGDTLTLATYDWWTGLIGETQRQIDGDITVAGVPAERAAGVIVTVLSPVVLVQSGAITIVAENDADRDNAKAMVASAFLSYVNGLNIGEDLIVTELIRVCKAVPGVYDLTLTIPAANVPVGDGQLARLQSTNLVVN